MAFPRRLTLPARLAMYRLGGLGRRGPAPVPGIHLHRDARGMWSSEGNAAWLSKPLQVRRSFSRRDVREEPSWPVPGTSVRRLHLDARRGLLVERPVDEEGSVAYVASRGRATFVFRFDRDTEVTGGMRLRLWIAPEGPTTQTSIWTARDRPRRSRATPPRRLQKVAPGQVTPADVEILPSSTMFEAGIGSSPAGRTTPP